MPRRHLIIPDCQIRPGVDTRHIDWAAQAIVDYLPDVIVVIGDWWDFPSLNSHEVPGSAELQGKRIKDEIDAGNEAFIELLALSTPIPSGMDCSPWTLSKLRALSDIAF